MFQDRIPKLSCIGTAKDGSHIIAVYKDVIQEMDEGFEFLKLGLQKSEVLMMITDAMSKDDVLERMSDEWNVDAEKLEAEGTIIVKTTTGWYFPDGKANAEHINKKWNALVSMASMNGKKGIRVFGDISGFFSAGLSKELVDYETSLPTTFQIPMTAICAYSTKEIEELEPETVERLVEHHGVMWA